MEKAKLIIKGEGRSANPISVLFNPEQYNLSRSVNYAKIAVPGQDNPILQFISGRQTTLNLTLHFDTQNNFVPKNTEPDVRKLTAPLMDALYIDGRLHTPPIVCFHWGSFSFNGVITDAKQEFTAFMPTGKPVRCKIDFTFQYAYKSSDKKKSPFESPDRTKIRTLEQDGALWRVAFAEYDNPAEWRRIAETNGIYNPRKCRAGQSLKVPPIIN